MQDVFEKIIEKLEEQKAKGIYDSNSIIGEKNTWAKAIEIVKQEAERSQSSEIGFISKTEVLKLIEEIKCNDDIPKNYGTLLDIMRMIRNMPTVDNTDNDWIPCSSGNLPNVGESDYPCDECTQKTECEDCFKEWIQSEVEE